MRTNMFRSWTVMVIFALALMILGSVQSVFAQGGYPLAGQSYEAQFANGSRATQYDPVWEVSGRLYQPNLPTATERRAFSVGITIEEGQYEYDGVECTLYLDERRNGQGSANPSQTFTRVNNARFTVDTADNGQAWALVECRGNESTGFQIQAISWTGSTVMQNPPAATNVPQYSPTIPAPAGGGDNPYGLTAASCQNNMRDGWVYDPSKLATASTCAETWTFDANDCPTTQNNAAINSAESNRLSVCSYYAPDNGGGLGDLGGDAGNWFSNAWNTVNGFIGMLFMFICGSPLLLLLLAILAIWFFFFRKPAEKKEGEGRFSNWRIVKWYNNRNAKPEAHDAHAGGKITINDEKNMEVEVDGNDAGFSFEPSFDVEGDTEFRTKWEKLPKGLTFDRDTGEITIEDATLLKRGTFPATLTITTIEDHPVKAVGMYKIKVTPKARGTQPDDAHDDDEPTNPPTDPNAGKVPVLIGGKTEWVTPEIAQFLATLSNTAPANLDTTVRQQDDTRRSAATTVRHASGEFAIATNPNLPSAKLNQQYQVGDKKGFGIRVDGAQDHRLVKRTITSGNIPAGMTFSESGWLAGTPTETGDFDFVVLATEPATGKTAEQQFHLHVEA